MCLLIRHPVPAVLPVRDLGRQHGPLALLQVPTVEVGGDDGGKDVPVGGKAARFGDRLDARNRPAVVAVVPGRN